MLGAFSNQNTAVRLHSVVCSERYRRHQTSDHRFISGYHTPKASKKMDVVRGIPFPENFEFFRGNATFRQSFVYCRTKFKSMFTYVPMHLENYTTVLLQISLDGERILKVN